MAEEQKEKPQPTKKNSEAKLWLMILGGMLLLGALYALSLPKLKTPESEQASAENTDADQSAETKAASESPESSMVMASGVDVEKAKIDRILGNPSAPIKVSEFASLTCSHCAHFHKDTMPEFKKNYIDTGKAYLVFSDFPLNPPALHASMIGRCLPEERYFDYIGSLFAEQENWAGNANYLDYIKGKAVEYGLPVDKFEPCLKSTELQDSFIKKIEAVQKQWSINSTPSFLINNQVVISGALTYADFVKKLEEAIVKINSPESSAPADQAAPPVAAEPPVSEGE